ncbi:MAG: TIGR00296 family protein [Candidatus Diapherotrites archaeon]|nr:TIGR00296 family protein [Candidatus Diapherotrites archaeon]
MELSEKECEELIIMARKAIEYYNLTGRIYSANIKEKGLMQKKGVFVTLHTYPENELRGCIGIPYPEMPLIKAVIEAAVGSSRDPRFLPVYDEELKKCIVEISVLSKPEKIDNKMAPKIVVVGKHGVIIRRSYHSGLLLPQVAIEYGWNSETFLEQACLKAGLQKNFWRMPDTEIFIFEAFVFKEEKPCGKVLVQKLNG